MAENYMTTITEKGEINISEDVITTMVTATIMEVEGVSGLASNVGNEILDFIGKRTLNKGVKISVENGVVTVDVLVVVTFGAVVADVARNVQNTIAGALESMAGISPVVNVHVSGVSFKANAGK